MINKIGLISDTHLGIYPNTLMKQLRVVFKDVTNIAHAGDIVAPVVLDALEEIAPVIAVRGNMDQHSILSNLPTSRRFRVGRCIVGLMHGWGAPGTLMKRVYSSFEPDPPDVIVFGHSHKPLVRRYGKSLMINPGSATERRYSPYHSVGLLTISEDKFEAEIIKID